MVPAVLPEGVEAAVKEMRKTRTSLDLIARKVKKKLAQVPGELRNNERVHLVREKCGKCQPCQVKDTCGTCGACQSHPGTSTRKQLQEQDHPACMEEHRRCTEWEPGSKSVASGSSAASAITPKSFEKNLSILRE